uniref:interleukin-5 receptor subunit alpha-like isoform X4 n=1 Tax=Pristiophorus japonicus TaxID=55135 RepID=UPI00398F0F1D
MALATSFLLMATVWTIAVDGAALACLEETIKMNPPTDVKISPGRLGEYIVSWSSNCTQKDNISYQLDYRYLDTITEESWKSRTVKIHQKELDLEFHRGLFAKVKLLGNDEHNSNIPDYWTEKIFDPPRDLFASINNLSCIFYDNNYMNCTWDINKETPQGAQYFLSYRQTNEDTVTNCTNYHKDGQRNVACYGHKYEIDSIDEVNICVSESSNKTTLPFCRKMHPAGFYKLYTPINVTINENTDEVKWKLPKGNVNSSCYIYEIKITNRSNRGSIQNVENLTGGKYVISRDQKKKYSVQVRGKVVFECYESIFWSDWSKPLIIGASYCQKYANQSLTRRRSSRISLKIAMAIFRNGLTRIHC